MKIETKMFPVQGITLNGTWIPYYELEELESADGGEGFYPGAILDREVEKALIDAGLAHESTKGSLFPTMPKFRQFMESIEFE